MVNRQSRSLWRYLGGVPEEEKRCGRTYLRRASRRGVVSWMDRQSVETDRRSQGYAVVLSQEEGRDLVIRQQSTCGAVDRRRLDYTRRTRGDRHRQGRRIVENDGESGGDGSASRPVRGLPTKPASESGFRRIGRLNKATIPVVDSLGQESWYPGSTDHEDRECPPRRDRIRIRIATVRGSIQREFGGERRR